jgi:hypothetical protein
MMLKFLMCATSISRLPKRPPAVQAEEYTVHRQMPIQVSTLSKRRRINDPRAVQSKLDGYKAPSPLVHEPAHDLFFMALPFAFA